jgi:hypothetical protein
MHFCPECETACRNCTLTAAALPCPGKHAYATGLTENATGFIFELKKYLDTYVLLRHPCSIPYVAIGLLNPGTPLVVPRWYCTFVLSELGEHLLSLRAYSQGCACRGARYRVGPAGTV